MRWSIRPSSRLGAELTFTTPKIYRCAMKGDELEPGGAAHRWASRWDQDQRSEKRLRRSSRRSKPPKAPEDEAVERALAHPEVKRFQELFGGQVRAVRNLKE